MIRKLPRALLGFAVFAALSGLARSDSALGCACCTSEGQRNVNVVALDSGKRAEIERLRFAGEARLFMGEAGPESVEGIVTPSERYALEAEWRDDQLLFALRNAQGHAGTLSLNLPGKISIFEVDPRDGSDRGQGPALYKEWKLTAKAAGSGVLASAGASGQFVTLIVQGRGNACTSADDFSHWTLVVEGPKGNYSLFGALVRTP